MDIFHNSRVAACHMHGEYTSRTAKLGNVQLPWSNCPKCNLINREEQEAESARLYALERQRRLDSNLKKSGIPLRFQTKTFASFIADSAGKEHALVTAMSFVKNFKSHSAAGTTVIFSGMVGTGKSHLASAIAMEVMKTGTVHYTSAIDAVRLVRDTWRRDSQQTETQVLQMLVSIDLLVLDEIGVQYGTEAEQVTLFDIIDKRYRDLKPTILLSNLGAPDIKKFLGDRTFDRLRENGIVVKFDWESQRGKLRVAA